MQRAADRPAHSTSRRLALVTGATSGLGQALCELLASKGYAILATGRDEAKLKAVYPLYIAADLKDRESRKRVVNAIHQHVPDLIINNAGFGLYGDALSLTVQEQLEMVEVNVNAAFELTLEGAKALTLAKKRGTIVNISSAAAFFTYPSFAVYAASKTCVNQFSQALDIEFEPLGVRVLCACPGKIATDFQRRASHNKYTKREMFTMSAVKAARLVWKQIEAGKREYIFDWRYRLSVALSRLLPRSWVQKLLRAEILKRING
jgi:hypothetical protein